MIPAWLRHPALSLAGLAALATTTKTPAPTTPGVNYKLTVTTRLPAMGGGGGGNVVIHAHAASTATNERVDVDNIEPNDSPIMNGDYFIMLDTNHAIAVNPPSSSYTEKFSLSGLVGLSAMNGMGGRTADMMAQMTVDRTQIKVTPDGDGGKIEGHATQRFKVMIDFAVMTNGFEIPIHEEGQIWIAPDLSVKMRNPFDQLEANDASTANMAQLYAKWAEAKKVLPAGAVLKTNITTSIDISSMSNGAIPSLDITTTMQVSDLKTADVDDAMFTIPKDYKKGG